MATITITRGLDPLISVFNQQSIEFTITTGVIPTVTVASIAFMPTKTATNIGGLDTYVMDFTDILRYYLGFPPTDFTYLYDTFTKDLVITVSGLGATNQIINTILCFGVSNIGENRIYNSTPNTKSVYYKGRYNVIYTNNAKVSFFLSGADGTYDVTRNVGSTTSETLKHGYNEMSGFDVEGIYNVSIKLAAPPFTTYCSFTVIASTAIDPANTIQWIDQDGALNAWTFNLLSTIDDVKDSNEIPLYTQTHIESKGNSFMISKEANVKYNLYTIAKDKTHFEQLIKIKRSICILGFGKLLKVTSSPTEVAECKQNLRFNITLEYTDNAQSY